MREPEKTDTRLYLVEQEPLALHTSWRIGGPARYYTEATTVEDVRRALEWSNERGLPVFLLGGGTNILVRDQGFDGLVIRYTAREWHIDENQEQGLLYAEAGAPIGRLVWMVGAHGWANLEWAAGLPGSVGGAVFGNAGCYGGDMARVVRRVWVLVGGEVEEWTAEQMGYGYRNSVLKQEQKAALVPANATSTPPDEHQEHHKLHPAAPTIILASEIALVQDESAALMEKMQHIATLRKEKTPAGKSCGSVFQNPSGGLPSAGQLIDEAGLKGTRIGGAAISQLHANYILNLENATSDDVMRLIEKARETVLHRFGVELELEIRIV